MNFIRVESYPTKDRTATPLELSAEIGGRLLGQRQFSGRPWLFTSQNTLCTLLWLARTRIRSKLSFPFASPSVTWAIRVNLEMT